MVQSTVTRLLGKKNDMPKKEHIKTMKSEHQSLSQYYLNVDESDRNATATITAGALLLVAEALIALVGKDV